MQVIDFFKGTLVAYVQFLLEKVPAAVLTLIFGWLAIKLLTYIVDKAMKAAKAEPTIASLFRAAISAAGWIIVIGAALKALGLGEVALAVSGSIALVALAIGTAASGTTGDIIAGVFLASDEDFKVGYTVTAAGVTGVIKSIDLRKSRIVAEDGKLHVVPNKAVETATWVVEARGETEEEEK
jgi:small-conductance mechanosensitive channel